MANILYKSQTPAIVFRPSHHVTHVEAFAYFREFLSNFNCFTESDLESLEDYWTVKRVKKNDYFFKADQVVNEIGFIVQGAVKHFRQYNGHYQVLSLLTEANFCTMKKSFYLKMPTIQNTLCVENTTFVTIEHDTLIRLFEEIPVFYTFFTEISEDIILFLEKRLSAFQLLDAQKRYEELIVEEPDILFRFNLQDISNYLGIKPETLSRIRSNMQKKTGTSLRQ